MDEVTTPDGTGSAEECFGKYRLIRQVGRGGQGVVYEAADVNLGRRVALKMLAPGFLGSSADLIRRFEREAEAASRLDHPGICAVYDFGRENGVPFMAMRLLEGETLAQLITRARNGVARWSPTCLEIAVEDDAETTEVVAFDTDAVFPPPRPQAASREAETSATPPSAREDVDHVVAIFEKSARALHVAHEGGITHRDIKPANIMVLPSGQPVIMDFGLAHGEWGDSATLTKTGELFGTLPYMAPEQLRDREVGGDPRVDVYALGVSLYEALSLRRPFEAATQEALYNAILVREPPDVRVINPSVPRDLAVIVGTAIDKDPDRRYRTALALAEEIARFRAREPIEARPAGRWLRAWRWAQRNPALSSSLVVIFVLLVSGLGVSLSLLKQSLDAQAEAERQRSRSERRFEEVRALARYFIFDLHDAVASLPGSTQAREQMVVKALGYLDRLASESSGDRSLLSELADAYVRVGDVQGNPHNPNLGDPSGAIRSYQKALALYADLFRSGPIGVSLLRKRLSTHFALGDTLRGAGHLDGAGEHYRQARRFTDKLVALDPDEPRFQYFAWRGLLSEGELALSNREVDAARTALERALTLSRISPGPDAPDALLRRPSMAHVSLGRLEAMEGNYATALHHYAEALEIDADRMRRNPRDDQPRRDHMVVVDSIGEVYVEQGRLADAKKHFERVLGGARQAQAADPADVRRRRDVAVLELKLAEVHSREGDHAEAYRRFAASVPTLRAIAEADPLHAQAALDLTTALGIGGEASLRASHSDRARKEFQEALRVLDGMSSRRRAEHLLLRASLFEGLGEAELAAGESNAALAAYRQCIAERQKALKRLPLRKAEWRELSFVYMRCADVLENRGEPEPAIASMRKALEIDRRLAKERPNHAETLRDVAVTLLALAPSLQRAGETREAGQRFDEAVVVLRRAAGEAGEAAFHDLAAALRQKGDWQLASGDPDGAQKTVREAIGILEGVLEKGGGVSTRSRLATALNSLARICDAAGRVEASKAAFRRALDLHEALIGEVRKPSRHRWNAAVCRTKLAEIFAREDDLDGALSELEAAMSTLVPEGASVKLSDASLQRHLFTLCHRAAKLAVRSGALDPALAYLKRARELEDQVARHRPQDQKLTERRLITRMETARVLALKDEHGRAVRALTRTRKLAESLVESAPGEARYHLRHMALLHLLAVSLDATGEVEEAVDAAAASHAAYLRARQGGADVETTPLANLRLLRRLSDGDAAATRKWELATLDVRASAPSPAASVLERYARELLAAPGVSVEVAQRARGLAQRAVKLTDSRDARALVTLALACAAAGDDDGCAHTVRRASALVPEGHPLRPELDRLTSR